MSNDKPCAVATITFYANKHVEVELSTIRNISPRTLDIASHILLKTYRGMKAQFIADEHKNRRKADAEALEQAAKDEAAFHEAEDERLRIAALPENQEVAEETSTEPDEPEEVEAPEEEEAPEETETEESEDEAANDPDESKDETGVA